MISDQELRGRAGRQIRRCMATSRSPVFGSQTDLVERTTPVETSAGRGVSACRVATQDLSSPVAGGAIGLGEAPRA
jgi:hypothetical protein